MKLLLVRHGESVGNAEGRIQGRFDSPLSERGRAQAHALAKRLVDEGWTITAMYASTLIRAAETAEILSGVLDIPLVFDERLREHNAGVLNGVLWNSVEQLYPEVWHGFHHSREWVPIPEAEGPVALRARMAAALADIQARHGDDVTVAIVSHGGSLGMLLAHLLDLDPCLPNPFWFDNTSVSLVRFTERGPRITRLNDTCHLTGDLR